MDTRSKGRRHSSHDRAVRGLDLHVGDLERSARPDRLVEQARGCARGCTPNAPASARESPSDNRYRCRLRHLVNGIDLRRSLMRAHDVGLGEMVWASPIGGAWSPWSLCAGGCERRDVAAPRASRRQALSDRARRASMNSRTICSREKVSANIPGVGAHDAAEATAQADMPQSAVVRQIEVGGRHRRTSRRRLPRGPLSRRCHSGCRRSE